MQRNPKITPKWEMGNGGGGKRGRGNGKQRGKDGEGEAEGEGNEPAHLHHLPPALGRAEIPKDLW